METKRAILPLFIAKSSSLDCYKYNHSLYRLQRLHLESDFPALFMARQPRYAIFSPAILYLPNHATHMIATLFHTHDLLSSSSFSCIKSLNGFSLMPFFHFVPRAISILFLMLSNLPDPFVEFNHSF